jgi:hypothetical protein
MRTYLRGKVTLLFMTFGLLLAIPAIALADTITADPAPADIVVVENNVNKVPGDTGSAKVWLTVDDNSTDPVNGCNANDTNPVSITLTSSSPDVTFDSSGTKANPASLTVCGSAAAKEIGYTVSSSPSGTLPKTVTVTASGSGGRTTGGGTNIPAYTADTFTITINPPPNTAPSTPGKPELASGFNTPNQGVFDLTWTASTDDGKPNPPAAVTYRLEHQDADDAAYSLVSGAGTLSTNSFSFPSASKENEGTWTYQVKASDSVLTSAFSDASSTIKVDRSPPSAPVATTTPVSPVFDGWFKDTVSVSYNGSTDPTLPDDSDGSGVASYTADQTFSTPSGTHNFSGKATDGAGNESAAVTGSVKVDATNPTFGDCTGGPFTQGSGNGSASVSITANDAHSGLDDAGTTLSSTVNTSTIGDKTFTFTAKDNVGHEVTKQCTYHVNYNWTGFFQPIDNNPDQSGNPTQATVWNSAKAGQAIPIKFNLSGNQGLSIFATKNDAGDPTTYPRSVKVQCPDSGDTIDAVETYSSSNAGLQYDPIANQYIYTWKTGASLANSCQMLDLKLADGTHHYAFFQFKR